MTDGVQSKKTVRNIMTSARKVMPIGEDLVNLRKNPLRKYKEVSIRYNGVTHKILLYAKFKKKAFPWDAWNQFHSDTYDFRRNSGESFQNLVVGDYLYHRIIDGIDWFQITPHGEMKLITIAENDQRRRAKASSESSARGRMTYLQQHGKK